jgi:hypothetical protein
MKIARLLSLILVFLTAATAASIPTDTLLTDVPALEKRACNNDPKHRDCWSGSYNINTDFETTWPNTGKTKYVRLF